MCYFTSIAGVLQWLCFHVLETQVESQQQVCQLTELIKYAKVLYVWMLFHIL